MGGETERVCSCYIWKGIPLARGPLHPEAAAAYIRLETLVRKNILSKHSSLGYLEKVLTDEEKQMLPGYSWRSGGYGYEYGNGRLLQHSG